MAPLALVLHLALASPGVASPGLVPMLDPGPFRGRELAAASGGVFVGDALVIGGGYLALKLFANGTFSPTASNFRTAAYVLAASALLVPPLTGALFARWARKGPASGALWKAVVLASLGQVAALGAGYAAMPHFWVVLPVQLVAISAGASLGLHWGPRARVAPTELPTMRRGSEPPPASGAATALGTQLCPDLPPVPRRAARVG
jgi:hypothetical protein